MKIRTAVISVVVSAALVCGAGYGAYYTMKGKESPVEVVPVMNVNTTYWDDSSVYGSVTSQVSQTVNLLEDYKIAEIYVQAGDEVKIGDPLFAYDMTLQELELEMEQLSLQTSELEMVRLEKELEKLKNTRATASLESDRVVRTAAADSEILEMEDETAGQGGGDTASPNNDPAVVEESGSEGEDSQKGNTGTGGFIENIEVQNGEVPGSAAVSEEEERREQERQALLDGVSRYEILMASIDGLFRDYGDELTASQIGDAVKEAVSYYRKNLAEERITEETDENGGTVQVRKYVLKDSVKEALGETAAELEKYGEQMETYHGAYVRLLIQELDPDNPGNIAELLIEAREEYASLTTAAREEVTNLSHLEELETAAANGAFASEDQTGEAETTGETETTGDAETPGSGGETDVTETPGNGGETDVTEAPGSGETDVTETPGNGGETDVTETPGSGGETNVTEAPGNGGETNVTEAPGNGGETNVTEAPETGTPGETVPTEQQSETQTESETETETETEVRYTLKVSGGYIEAADQNLESESFPAGATVTVAAEESDLQAFQEWSWVTASGEELEIADPTSLRITFVMPASDVELTARFLSNDEKIQNAINAFYSLADEALGVIGTQKEEYDATALETALQFYQQNLAEQSADIADGSSAAMEDYEPRQIVADYLTAQERAHEIETLSERYKELCFTFVKTLVNGLDPQNLTREAYERAKGAYDALGLGWQEELDSSVYGGETETEAPADGTMSVNGQTSGVSSQTGEEESGSGTGEEISGTVILTYGEKLGACEVILMIQELDLEQPEALLISALEQARDAYLALNQGQRSIVWNAEYLIGLLRQYGLWQEETEPMTGDGFPGDGGYDGFDDGDGGYTAAELKEMIEEMERSIKECALDIREGELAVKQKQRIVDEKVVTSTLDGTVITIGTIDGNSENSDYFLKVSNETGLYAKGVMNELAFNTLKIGDTISGTSMVTGTEFTAVISEISEYPDPNGASMSWSWGSENTNASYYPFYALIDDTEGLEEGEAELKLEAPKDNSDDIYLPKYLVRTGSDGRSYVYMRGEDGKLIKQYVTLGKTIYSYAVQILEGLSLTDEVAFPYGKNVYEGAATKQVDMFEDAYM